MDTDARLVTVSEAMVGIRGWLDRVDPNRRDADDADRLQWMRDARQIADRLAALAAVLTGEAELSKSAQRVTGTPLLSLLGVQENLSRREAAGAVGRGKALVSRPRVARAALAGELGGGQVRAISATLESLTPDLTVEQQVEAEKVMVGMAQRLNAGELSGSAGRVLEQVTRADGDSDERLERRLQREAEAAHRERSVRFYRVGASVRFVGSLPRTEAERWIAGLDRLIECRRRTVLEARDPLDQALTPEQRRADALMAMIRGSAPIGAEPTATSKRAAIIAGRAPAARSATDQSVPAAPEHGARITVALDYDKLQRDAAGAGLLGVEPLSAGELRRVCCDAELIPVVLGTRSQVFDVGRAHRLVTPAIRTALAQRDVGCAFPGCDVPPTRCEAHHIEPWWAGGITALSNLVMLCRHHHGLIEPARRGVRDQWAARISADGLPEFIPPVRLHPQQIPVRHARHRPDEATLTANRPLASAE